MGREFELKFKAAPQSQDALQSHFSGFREIRMETTYFDTPDGAFSARKITLRLRRENDSTICTLKTPCAGGGRGEWECPASTLEQGLPQLLALGAPQAAILLAQTGTVAVCGARFTRLVTTLPTADGTAELALDRGILLGGGRQLPLCEVELEQKSGSDGATAALAAVIAEKFGLIPETNSKFRRALALTQGEV